jgi:8-oxo-dGTP pyrophosphatase MutT (NUDIX family)
MSAAPQIDLRLLRERVGQFVPRRAQSHGRPAAVLVPILPRKDGLHILFTERSAKLRAHAGQISFPGGKVDPGDNTMRETALREANEEVGLDRAHAKIIGELDDVPTFVTGYVITPIVAIIDLSVASELRYPWKPSAHEVTRLHELPLEEFLAPDTLRIEERERDGVRFELYWYTVRGTIVWGATARIVRQLLDLALGRPVAPPPWETGKP